MRYIIAVLSLISVYTLLVGCTTPTAKIITIDKTKPIVIPKYLLEPCEATLPPDKDMYIKSSVSEREELLIVYSVALLINLKECDNQITAIRKLQEKTVNTYNTRK